MQTMVVLLFSVNFFPYKDSEILSPQLVKSSPLKVWNPLPSNSEILSPQIVKSSPPTDS